MYAGVNHLYLNVSIEPSHQSIEQELLSVFRDLSDLPPFNLIKAAQVKLFFSPALNNLSG